MEKIMKFKIKTFLYYLVIEPWTKKVSLPNFRSIAWALILVSVLLKIPLLIFISVLLGVFLHLIYEYKSGKFIYWYRQHQKNKLLKEARKLNKMNGSGEVRNGEEDMPEMS